MSLSRIPGRHELAEQLAEGGRGVVWWVLGTMTGDCVAIKLRKDTSAGWPSIAI